MEPQKPLQDGNNLFLRAFVVEQDAPPGDVSRVRRKERKHMAETEIREVDSASFSCPGACDSHHDICQQPSPAESEISTSSRSQNHAHAASSNFARAGVFTLSTAGASSVTKPQLTTPRTTILDLLTDTAAPSAFPQTLGFHISRKGRQIAVYNSTHIHLIDTEALPRAFVRTLEVKRRPIALDMLDDGRLLLLLDTPTILNVYQMDGGEGDAVERKATIDLQHESRTIALSADGLVAAVGHAFGMELINLQNNSTRLVSTERMDSISFSDDSKVLLATTKAGTHGISTTISVAGPFDGPMGLDGMPTPMEVDRAWASQILFPEKAMTCRHATLIPDTSIGQAPSLFAYDSQEGTWGTYDLEACAFISNKEFLPDLARRVRYEFIEDALPAVSPSANHVAIAVDQRGYPEVWVYALPSYEEQLAQDEQEKIAGLRPCLRIPMPRDENISSQEIAALRWLKVPSDPSIERLVTVGSTFHAAPGNGPVPQVPQNLSATGVIVVMDFDLHGQSGRTHTPTQKIVFDLDSLLPGEKLPEDEMGFEREVELLRRRTIVQRNMANRAAARRNSPQSIPTRAATQRPRASHAAHFNSPAPLHPLPDDEQLSADEAVAVFEEPYANAQPRSVASLQRAATVAASSSAARRHLRAVPDRPLEYRRADGLREIPHESDADNWEPPPPAYTAKVGESDAAILASTPMEEAPRPALPVVPVVTVASSTSVPTTSSVERRTLSRRSQRLSRPESLVVPSTRPLSRSYDSAAGSRSATVLQSATFPRAISQRNPAGNMVASTSGSGLRRSSSTFPGSSAFPSHPSIRPSLSIDTSGAPFLPYERRQRPSVSVQGIRPSSITSSRPQRDVSAYEETRSASVGNASATQRQHPYPQPQQQPPPPQQQQQQPTPTPPSKSKKKGAKCVIM